MPCALTFTNERNQRRMAKTKVRKPGKIWCFNCGYEWDVPDRYAYVQCIRCKGYRVHTVGSPAYYLAKEEKSVLGKDDK